MMSDPILLLLELFQKRLEDLSPETETLTGPQAKILSFLHHHANPSVGQIAQGLGVSNPAATKALDRLVLKGYVDRKENPEDRRTVLLAVTSFGEEVLKGYREGTRDRFERLFHGMRPEEKRALKRGIRAFLSASFLEDQALIGRLCLRCGDEHSPDCLVNQASLALLESPIAEG